MRDGGRDQAATAFEQVGMGEVGFGGGSGGEGFGEGAFGKGAAGEEVGFIEVDVRVREAAGMARLPHASMHEL